jgi:chemotaxis protein MotB
MKSKIAKANAIIFIVCMSFIISGCTIILQRGRRTDIQKIGELTSQIDQLTRAYDLLGERLKREIADKQVRLEMAERGLVITFVADILFDSGRDKIKQEAFATLDKVALVLEENLSDFNVGIEGHTDNEPIRYSPWKSNWELSAHRALSVLYYLSQKGVSEKRLSAVGYGEYRPVAPNDTKEGMRLNRRVEIVVLPKIAKVKPQEENVVQEPVSMGQYK